MGGKIPDKFVTGYLPIAVYITLTPSCPLPTPLTEDIECTHSAAT
jgi:hypothetical protein